MDDLCLCPILSQYSRKVVSVGPPLLSQGSKKVVSVGPPLLSQGSKKVVSVAPLSCLRVAGK